MGKDSEELCLQSDKDLVGSIRQGDEEAFETLFFEYYYQLCRFSMKITKSSELARDTVQEVFYKVWRNRRDLEIRHSVKVYLYQAVRNQSLNAVEKRKNHLSLVKNFSDEPTLEAEFQRSDDGTAKYSKRLIDSIWKLVAQMPERRKQVFTLHRKHGLSYKEISKVMAISDKTVENHMGYALRYIRDNIDRDNFC